MRNVEGEMLGFRCVRMVVEVVARSVAVQIFVYTACGLAVDEDLQMLVNLASPQNIRI